MKKPWLAFLCNFLLAGAGFVYLGKWMWAVVDLFVTLLIGVILYRLVPDQFTWLTAPIPAANGLLALNMTKLWNSRAPKMQPTT
jgi:TM2 domain-containing membrane protein YozV